MPSDADNANAVVSAVKWSSSDETIATVSSSGVITGVAEGTATITATSGPFTATVSVTVIPIDDTNNKVGEAIVGKAKAG